VNDAANALARGLSQYTRVLGMTLENMFYISQTIAAFAIVGSLLFVGLEVRHSNLESRHRTIEEMLGNFRSLSLTIASNADTGSLWLRGLHDLGELEPVDKVRFLSLARTFFFIQQSFFLHHRSGYMPSEIYQPHETSTSDVLGYPGMQAAWEQRKSYFQKSFRTMMDEKVAAAKKSGIVPSYYPEGHA
jgi:hypothetical protein